MIAAFITASVTAFLAEPIKAYFENKRIEDNIRKALYAELLDNFHHLLWNVEKMDKFQESAWETSARLVHNECYMHVREKDIVSYFKMYDSAAITLLNDTINRTIEIYLEKKSKKQKTILYRLSVQNFVESLSFVVYNGYLDRKIIKAFLHEEDYLRLIEIGKKVDKDGFSISSLHQLGERISKVLALNPKSKG